MQGSGSCLFSQLRIKHEVDGNPRESLGEKDGKRCRVSQSCREDQTPELELLCRGPRGTHKCDTLTSEGHNLQAIGLFTQIRSDHIYKLGSTTSLKPQDSRAPTLKAPML